jgi:hypothetical protein
MTHGRFRITPSFPLNKNNWPSFYFDESPILFFVVVAMDRARGHMRVDGPQLRVNRKPGLCVGLYHN